MLKKLFIAITIFVSMQLLGCATVPMESANADKARKEFASAPDGKSGLYVYRNSSFGAALKKTITLDGVIIGESAANTYFYKEIPAGEHELATESEFSDNKLTFTAKSGANYYVHQYIKFGVFVGGAGVELVSEEVGKKGVLECKLAKDNPNIQ